MNQIDRKILMLVFLLLLPVSGCRDIQSLTALPAPSTSVPAPTPTPEAPLLGKWERVTPRNLTIPVSAVLPDHIEFLQNNIWIASSFIHGQYSLIPDSRIQFDGLPVSPILSYALLQDTLKFSDESYNTVIYRRDKAPVQDGQ